MKTKASRFALTLSLAVLGFSWCADAQNPKPTQKNTRPARRQQEEQNNAKPGARPSERLPARRQQEDAKVQPGAQLGRLPASSPTLRPGRRVTMRGNGVPFDGSYRTPERTHGVGGVAQPTSQSGPHARPPGGETKGQSTPKSKPEPPAKPS